MNVKMNSNLGNLFSKKVLASNIIHCKFSRNSLNAVTFINPNVKIRAVASPLKTQVKYNHSVKGANENFTLRSATKPNLLDSRTLASNLHVHDITNTRKYRIYNFGFVEQQIISSNQSILFN